MDKASRFYTAAARRTARWKAPPGWCRWRLVQIHRARIRAVAMVPEVGQPIFTTATDMAQAMVARRTLPPRASFVAVAEGHLVGRNAIQFIRRRFRTGRHAGPRTRRSKTCRKQARARDGCFSSDEAKTQAVRADRPTPRPSQALAEARTRAEQATRRVHTLQMDVL